MLVNNEGQMPIYLQIAAWLEEEIFAGRLVSDERIYSQYQLAEMFNINPATAAKGLNHLAEGELIYKRRGLGMFVSADAKNKIEEKRRSVTLGKLINDLAHEAKLLSISEDELFSLLHQALEKEGGRT